MSLKIFFNSMMLDLDMTVIHRPRAGIGCRARGTHITVALSLSVAGTILGHRAGPARHGPGTGQARPAGVGPARHAVPPVPCLTGPRAPLTAQARPLGLKFGPCRPHSPAKTCGPCQPTPRIVENRSSDS